MAAWLLDGFGEGLTFAADVEDVDLGASLAVDSGWSARARTVISGITAHNARTKAVPATGDKPSDGRLIR
jgi:hypothetical protein